ncbi:MAG: EamA family transporter [Actinomycetota bacterium]
MQSPGAFVRKQPHAILVWIALSTVYLVWGSTYLAIRVVVETMPPLLTAGVRFLIAGAIVYLWILARRGRAAVRVTRREVLAASVVGGALLLGGNGLVSIAELTVPSALAALIIASTPLWVILLRAVTGEKVSRLTLGAVAVGFAGVGILVLPGNRPDGVELWGILLLIVAAANWATGSFLSQRLALPGDPFLSTGIQMLCGGAILIAAGLVRGEASSLEVAAFSGASLAGLAYLIVFGSLVAFTAYVWVLQNAPISRVATYAYVNPVVAIFLGWAILSEEITATTLVGAAVILTSVAFTLGKEKVVGPADRPALPEEPVSEDRSGAPAMSTARA